MPFHLCGFSESQDSAALVNVAALDDDTLTIAGDDITVPADTPLVIAAHVLGANTTRALLRSPSIISQRTAYELTPIDVAALPSSPPRTINLFDNPLELVPSEQLNAQAAEDAAGAARSTVLLWLADGPPAPAEGGAIRKIRASSTLTAVANAWTSGVLTLTDNLEAGRYALIGAMCRSTNLQAFRFIFRGSPYRPGGLGAAVVSSLLPAGQRDGGWGVWGEFEHNELPRLEVLANAADASFTLDLDLARI